eukprot:624257-Pelagomonas_calceolata.AAC.1
MALCGVVIWEGSASPDAGLIQSQLDFQSLAGVDQVLWADLSRSEALCVASLQDGCNVVPGPGLCRDNLLGCPNDE